MKKDAPNTTKPQGTSMQAEDPQIATKAEERRRRLANMMMDTDDAAGKAREANVKTAAQSQQLSAPGTAVFAKSSTGNITQTNEGTHTKEGYAKNPPSSSAIVTPGTATFAPSSNPDQKRVGASASTNVPSPLNDLEIKASVRQGHVSRLLRTEEQKPSTATATTAPPSSLSDLEIKASVRQGHVSRLLSGETSNTTPPASGLAALEADALAKQRFPREVGAVAPSSTTTKMDALLIPQRLPSGIPDPPSAPADDGPTEVTAELVDDEYNREKILREAQAELISKAVVASVKDDEEQHRSARCRWMTITAAACLLLMTIVVGGVCGSGLCATTPTISPVERANAITELINHESFRSTPVVYPTSTSRPQPEEEALKFLIDNDTLQLSASADATRLLQRYAITVLWYANGPFDSLSTDGDSDAQKSWFAQPDECQWFGVACNDEGHVVQLVLEGKALSGELPVDIALLTELTELSLPDNELNGTLPLFLGELQALEVLDLSYNSFTGPPCPANLPRLSNLREYQVKSNKLNGTIPDLLVNMTQLEFISFDFNDLTGTIPDFVGELTYLTHLSLGDNKLTGTVPDNIGRSLTDLTHLSVGGQSYSGVFSLLPLSGLRKLTFLSYSRNTLDELPEAIADWWPALDTIRMFSCGLNGTIPASVAKWTNMKGFNLDRNFLSGTVPPAVYDAWTNLEFFGVGTNDLTGTIPETVGTWTKAVSFDIRRNAFSGTLPTTVGLMTNLVQFLVTDNNLSGEIPQEVEAFESAYRWFDDNNFTGTAPFCDEPGLVSDRVDCDLVVCDCCANCV